MRILVTDDSRSIHAFVTSLFENTPHILDHAFNGEEALEKIKTSKLPFDLVLLDWEMPVLDGPSTLLRIKAEGISVPVLMVTTKGDLISITTALENGASDYVIKPFTKDILFGRITTICGTEVA